MIMLDCKVESIKTCVKKAKSGMQEIEQTVDDHMRLSDSIGE